MFLEYIGNVKIIFKGYYKTWVQVFIPQDGNPSFENIRGRKWDGNFFHFINFILLMFLMF